MTRLDKNLQKMPKIFREISNLSKQNKKNENVLLTVIYGMIMIVQFSTRNSVLKYCVLYIRCTRYTDDQHYIQLYTKSIDACFIVSGPNRFFAIAEPK